jgi:Mrp family chromosome partitioning ATPase
MDSYTGPRLLDLAQLRRAQESARQEVSGDAGPELTDTITFRSPIMSTSREQLAAQRVLPPGAAGPSGSAYKMLRTQVLRRLDQLGANTLAIIGATEGTGKTLTAINLAIAIAAEVNRTALLVDLDLRNPSLHRYLGFTPVKGVGDCLLDRIPAQLAMVKLEGYERLTILPARQPITDSSELLADQVTGNLVQDLRQRYLNRVVIFDLPPVLQADDALAFSKYVQAGLLVVREGHTQRDDVSRSLQLLQELKFVGTVLNAARDQPAMYY